MVGMVVDRCMDAGERSGRGSRTRPVRLEEPGLVAMSDAERSAAVAALADILAAWLARQQETGHDRTPAVATGRSEHTHLRRVGRMARFPAVCGFLSSGPSEPGVPVSEYRALQ
jgi:hypothetical protein